MDAVAALMKERQRLEEWLAQLESRRSITPPHVFERVRGDSKMSGQVASESLRLITRWGLEQRRDRAVRAVRRWRRRP